MHRTLHFYLVSKGLPDVKPFLVNLLVVRAILPEKGVHVRNMALAAQVVEAIPAPCYLHSTHTRSLVNCP